MQETILQKLNRLAKESEQELASIGLGDKIKKDISYTINYRAKKRFGQCCNKRDINISSWLLEVGTDKDIKDTIIHEILHTFNDTRGHDVKWKYYAEYVNSKTDYNIDRLGSKYQVYNHANKIPPQEHKHYKWEITCTKCGRVWYWQRLTQKGLEGFMHGTRYHKSCGGRDFRIVDLDKCEEIW